MKIVTHNNLNNETLKFHLPVGSKFQTSAFNYSKFDKNGKNVFIIGENLLSLPFGHPQYNYIWKYNLERKEIVASLSLSLLESHILNKYFAGRYNEEEVNKSSK